MSFNVAAILSETASASPGKAVAVYAGGQLTYGELDALSDRLAAALEMPRASTSMSGVLA